MRRRFGTAWVALATLSIVAVATASDDSERAEKLFQQARTLLDSDDYDEACIKLQQSQKLDPGAGTLALLAYCHEMQGRTATAFAEYGGAVEIAKKRGDLERARTVESQRQRLIPKLSSLRLIVRHPVEGLSLVRNGKAVPKGEWDKRIYIDPGSWTVEARAPGHTGWTASVSVAAEGARVDVEIPALGGSSSDEGTSKANAPMLIAIGVGVVGVGVGSYFGLRAKSLNDDSNEEHCNGNLCDQAGFDKRKDAQKAALFSTIGFGVGIAGLATGAVLWWTRPATESRVARAVRVAPSRRGAWAGFEGRF